VDQEIAQENWNEAERIFSRLLPHFPSPDLWKSYLKFMIQSKFEDGEKSEESAKHVMDAFERALEHVGFDISASGIWTEYIRFLKETPTVCFLRLLCFFF